MFNTKHNTCYTYSKKWLHCKIGSIIFVLLPILSSCNIIQELENTENEDRIYYETIKVVSEEIRTSFPTKTYTPLSFYQFESEHQKTNHSVQKINHLFYVYDHLDSVYFFNNFYRLNDLKIKQVSSYFQLLVDEKQLNLLLKFYKKLPIGNYRDSYTLENFYFTLYDEYEKSEDKKKFMNKVLIILDNINTNGDYNAHKICLSQITKHLNNQYFLTDIKVLDSISFQEVYEYNEEQIATIEELQTLKKLDDISYKKHIFNLETKLDQLIQIAPPKLIAFEYNMRYMSFSTIQNRNQFRNSIFYISPNFEIIREDVISSL